MILSWIWVGMTAAALIFGALSGRLEAVSQAALSGAASAVELGISMAGTLCLWSGVMEILRLSGLSAGLARGFRPLLRRLFPQASRDPETLAAISANVSANLLGLGNAATPLGIRAVQRMAHGKGGAERIRKDTREDTASDEVCRLVVLNTASVQLIPASVAALRSAAGCAAPFDILPAVWTASILSVGAGLSAERLFSRLERKTGKGRSGNEAGDGRENGYGKENGNGKENRYKKPNGYERKIV